MRVVCKAPHVSSPHGLSHTDGGGDGVGRTRGPQSRQSVPKLHKDVNSAPAPPSSQSPSKAQLHVFEQAVVPDIAALVALAGGGGASPFVVQLVIHDDEPTRQSSQSVPSGHSRLQPVL